MTPIGSSPSHFGRRCFRSCFLSRVSPLPPTTCENCRTDGSFRRKRARPGLRTRTLCDSAGEGRVRRDGRGSHALFVEDVRERAVAPPRMSNGWNRTCANSRSAAFDLALNVFTSFGYFEDQAENRRVLENIFASLKPGGAFVFDHLGKEVLASQFCRRSPRACRTARSLSSANGSWTTGRESMANGFCSRRGVPRPSTSNIGFTPVERSANC